MIPTKIILAGIQIRIPAFFHFLEFFKKGTALKEVQ